MPTYEPSADLVKAVLAGIALPLPFVVGMAYKAVPFKEKVMSATLGVAIPTSLRAIASMQSSGTRIQLTKQGELTEETKRSILSRIADWFVPSEVKDVSSALQADITRMAEEEYAEESWRLEHSGGEVFIVITNTSFLRVSTDTVVDTFFNSLDGLRVLKDKLPFLGAKS